MANLLIDRGSNIDTSEAGDLDPSGTTILHSASMSGLQDVVEKFLRKGARPSIQDPNLETPLHLAVIHEKVDTVKLL